MGPGDDEFDLTSITLPDDNTAEAILFGKSYSWIKSALWMWDEVEDYLMEKANALDSQIIDRQWCYDVMKNNQYMIFARSAPVNEVDHLKDLFTLRNMVKVLAGLRAIEKYRKQNVSWARMKGIEQYVRSRADKPVSEFQWQAATAKYNTQPISYDYVNGLITDDMSGEYIDWNEAMRDLMGDDEYDKMVSEIFGEPEEEDDGNVYVDEYEEIEEEEPEEEEEEEEPEPEDEEEAEEEEDEEVSEPYIETVEEEYDEDATFFDDEFWAGTLPIIRQLFYVPTEYLVVAMQKEDDEFHYAANVWQSLDIDDRVIVDQLIGFMEEMNDATA